MIAGKTIISLIKLIDGGEAIFTAQKRNHHMEMIGQSKSIPLLIISLRVFVFS
jgi:hypothetical protein